MIRMERKGRLGRVYLGVQVEPKRSGGGGSRHFECDMRGRRRDSDYFGLIGERGGTQSPKYLIVWR